MWNADIDRYETHWHVKYSHAFILLKTYICIHMKSSYRRMWNTFTHSYMRMSKKLWECKCDNFCFKVFFESLHHSVVIDEDFSLLSALEHVGLLCSRPLLCSPLPSPLLSSPFLSFHFFSCGDFLLLLKGKKNKVLKKKNVVIFFPQRVAVGPLCFGGSRATTLDGIFAEPQSAV